MKYKKSKYNIIIDEKDGKYLLFNSLSGAYVLLNKESRELYENIEKFDVELQGDLLNYFNLMKENSIIIEYDIDEYKLLKINEENVKYNSSVLIMTIAPTMNCNMECPYCYEKKEANTMNKDVIDDLVKFVTELLDNNKYKELSIAWYGGEPLLAKEVIYELSKPFIDLCNDRKIVYNASMVSNGTLLDANISEKLAKDCKVRMVQVTLDGMPETNNKRRKLKNNQDSFDIITRNIKIASQFMNINVRSNVDKNNINEVNELIDFFKEEELLQNKNINLYFAPVTSTTTICKSISSSCLSMQEFSAIQEQIYNRLYEVGVIPNFPDPLSTSCPSIGTAAYVVDSEGFIYRCWDEIENKNQSIGNIKNGIKVNKRFIDWLSLKLPEKCTNCNVLPVCRGGCPFIRLQNKNEFECSHQSYVINHILKLYHKQYEMEKRLNV